MAPVRKKNIRPHAARKNERHDSHNQSHMKHIRTDLEHSLEQTYCK